MKLAILAVVSALGLGLVGGSAAHAGPNRPLRDAVKQQFDKNHDGKLQPRERRQAARALERLARRLARSQGRANGRKARHAKLIRRFDLDGDGNLGPGEIPPAIANELRPLDRDGDGWLRGDELP